MLRRKVKIKYIYLILQVLTQKNGQTYSLSHIMVQHIIFAEHVYLMFPTVNLSALCSKLQNVTMLMLPGSVTEVAPLSVASLLSNSTHVSNIFVLSLWIIKPSAIEYESEGCKLGASIFKTKWNFANSKQRPQNTWFAQSHWMNMTVIKHSRLLQPITKGKPNSTAHSLKETKAFPVWKLSKR